MIQKVFECDVSDIYFTNFKVSSSVNVPPSPRDFQQREVNVEYRPVGDTDRKISVGSSSSKSGPGSHFSDSSYPGMKNHSGNMLNNILVYSYYPA